MVCSLRQQAITSADVNLSISLFCGIRNNFTKSAHEPHDMCSALTVLKLLPLAPAASEWKFTWQINTMLHNMTCIYVYKTSESSPYSWQTMARFRCMISKMAGDDLLKSGNCATTTTLLNYFFEYTGKYCASHGEHGINCYYSLNCVYSSWRVFIWTHIDNYRSPHIHWRRVKIMLKIFYKACNISVTKNISVTIDLLLLYNIRLHVSIAQYIDQWCLT